MSSHSRAGASRIVHIEYVANDQVSRSSSVSPSLRSYESHSHPVHCKRGLDLIENLFSTIFGGCCRPSQVAAVDFNASGVQSGEITAHPSCGAEPQTPKRSAAKDGIAQPPQIRRLALDQEITAPDLDRSGSLSFLFYHDEGDDSS